MRRLATELVDDRRELVVGHAQLSVKGVSAIASETTDEPGSRASRAVVRGGQSGTSIPKRVFGGTSSKSARFTDANIRHDRVNGAAGLTITPRRNEKEHHAGTQDEDDR